LAEKFVEERLGLKPILLADAVFHLGRHYFALYESCVLQFGKMLRGSGLGNGQLLVDFAKETGLLLGKELHDGNACGIAQSLGISGDTYLLFSVFLFLHDLLFHLI